MPRSREATSTIKGYYFQFDYYILQLLYLRSDNASVCVEGIEDSDFLLEEIIHTSYNKNRKTINGIHSNVHMIF